MDWVLASIGSRGDIEPFVLLARALTERGHAVTLALDDGYRTGTSVTALPPAVQVVSLGALDTSDMVRAVARAVGAPSQLERSRAGFDGFVGHRAEALRDRMRALARTGATIVASEALLWLDAGQVPWTNPTAAVWYTLCPERDFRRLADAPCLRLVAVPEPALPVAPGLARALTFTGFWIDDRGVALPEHVERFLAEGAPPVFVTMGSMTGFDTAALAAALVGGARARGLRTIVQRGWAQLAPMAATDTLVVDEVDYSALFTRCAAVLTHGGAGTIAHALCAGRPVGVLPLVEDQKMWADAVARSGLGLGTLDPRVLTSDAVERLLGAIGDPALEARGAALAPTLRGGLARACDALETFAGARA